MERIANVALDHEHVDTNSGGVRYNIDTASHRYYTDTENIESTIETQLNLT